LIALLSNAPAARCAGLIALTTPWNLRLLASVIVTADCYCDAVDVSIAPPRVPRANPVIFFAAVWCIARLKISSDYTKHTVLKIH
jgi:hypothetical protein